MSQPTLAYVTSRTIPSDNVLRTGTVFKINVGAGTLTVDVGGTIMVLNRVMAYPVPAVGSTVALLRQESTWLVLGAITTDVPNRTGYVGAGVTSDTATITAGAETALAASSWDQEPSFPAQIGRIYRAEWRARVYVSGTIAQVIGTVRLRAGSASTTGAVLGTWTVDALTNFAAVSVNGWGLFRVASGISGVEQTTISLTAAKAAGTGTNINVASDPTERILVTIQDVTDVLNGDPAFLAATAIEVDL